MKYLRSLYVQVLLAIVAGIFLGYVNPELGATLKPLGDGFSKLIKMLIGPIIFATVVSGIGFITLAATLSATGTVPVAGMALILGGDRFMSEARAITNFIGNSVATLVVSKWDRSFDASTPEAKLVLK